MGIIRECHLFLIDFGAKSSPSRKGGVMRISGRKLRVEGLDTLKEENFEL
jgi:hypothetical protein